MITQIDPRYLKWDDWVRETIMTSDSLPGPVPEARWKDWARQTYMLQPNAPLPDSFGHWRFWVLAWQRGQS